MGMEAKEGGREVAEELYICCKVQSDRKKSG